MLVSFAHASPNHVQCGTPEVFSHENTTGSENSENLESTPENVRQGAVCGSGRNIASTLYGLMVELAYTIDRIDVDVCMYQCF